MRSPSLGRFASSLVLLGGLASATVASAATIPLSTPGSYLRAKQIIDGRHAADEAKHRFLAGRTQRAERARSRSAFRSQSRREAGATLKASFGFELDALDWVGSELAHRHGYRRFVSDYVAHVTVGGRKQLIDSTVPLRTKNEDGKLAPVDLSLVRDGGGYAPANPLVGVKLPRKLSEGIAVTSAGKTIKLVPADAAGAASVALVDRKAVLYANTSTDSDIIAAPLPTGLETYVQLRSPRAPETSRLRVVSGGDVTLQRMASGEVDVRVDEVVVGRVAPPWATDAQGTRLPVGMSVEGDTLVLTTAHHRKDVAYPILVDPIMDNWYNGGASNGSWFRGNRAGLENWAYAESPAGWYPHDTRCVGGIDCVLGAGGTNGLYMYSYAGAPYSGSAGHFSEWYYKLYAADSRTTYIPRVEYAYQWNVQHGGANNFVLFDAIGTTWGGYAGVAPAIGVTSNRYTTVNTGDNVLNPDVGAGKIAIFAAIPNVGTTSHPGSGTYYTGGAVVFLDDPEPPGLSVTHSSQPPNAWVKNASERVSFTGHDNGIGIRWFTVATDGNVWTSPQPSMNSTAVDCNGTAAAPCYSDRNGYFDYSTAALSDGPHTMQACAWDALAKTKCSTWPVYLDRTAPTVTFGGSAHANRLTSGGPDDPVLDGSSYSLSVGASDASSGVQTVVVKVDGITRLAKQYTDCTASEGCPHTRNDSLTIVPANEAKGFHTVTMAAIDQVGNEARGEFMFATAEPATPEMDETPDDTAFELAPIQCASTCTRGGDRANGAAAAEPALDPGGATPRTVTTGNWGLSDHNAAALDDPRTYSSSGLGLKRARNIIPWDIVINVLNPAAADARLRPSTLANPVKLEEIHRDERNWLHGIDAWMDNAKLRGWTPLVSFETSRGSRRENNVDGKGYLPSVAEYLQGVNAIIRRYNDPNLVQEDPNFRQPGHFEGAGFLSEFTAWNEPNHRAQPTYDNPVRAGEYWRALWTYCLCEVAAGDFLDTNLTNAYVKAYRQGLGYEPTVWAWHAYSAGKNQSATKLENFVNATAQPGANSFSLWLTEQGVYVHAKDPVTKIYKLRATEKYHAELEFLLNKLLQRPALRQRIKRFYYYARTGTSNGFDTGLLQFDSPGQPNPATRTVYDDLKARINP